MSTAKNPPKYYFCFRSPYSWIATRLIEEYLPEAERALLDYRIFWQPDAVTSQRLAERNGEFPYNHMNRERHLYILQDVKRITSALGWKHHWPVDEDPWWELPTLAYFKAESLGKGREFRNAVFKARWEDGLNIHELPVLEALAGECGLDPRDIALAAQDPVIKDRALEAALEIYEDGVFGIPFFMYKRNKFWGVDRIPEFLALLRGQPFGLVDIDKIRGVSS